MIEVPGAPALAIDTGIAVAAAPDQIWSILTGFAHYPVWNRFMVRVEGRAEAGATLRVTTRDERSRREVTQSVRVASAERLRMHWIGEAETPGTFRGDHVFALIPDGGGSTVFRHFERFSGSAAPAILDAYGIALRAGFELFNRCLKEAAERGGSTIGA